MGKSNREEQRKEKVGGFRVQRAHGKMKASRQEGTNSESSGVQRKQLKEEVEEAAQKRARKRKRDGKLTGSPAKWESARFFAHGMGEVKKEDGNQPTIDVKSSNIEEDKDEIEQLGLLPTHACDEKYKATRKVQSEDDGREEMLLQALKAHNEEERG
ncbi:hypothetical protein KI387_024277 [Taxus chinensis]|uniref:Uncharacterized protein n=1 Tax=Taxus chinensis TaxID=29808 RepID=A0AA38LBC5_TAXCH|nr:hypothetical protein KI387_024277 [Taxus chinensis]